MVDETLRVGRVASYDPDEERVRIELEKRLEGHGTLLIASRGAHLVIPDVEPQGAEETGVWVRCAWEADPGDPVYLLPNDVSFPRLEPQG